MDDDEALRRVGGDGSVRRDLGGDGSVWRDVGREGVVQRDVGREGVVQRDVGREGAVRWDLGGWISGPCLPVELTLETLRNEFPDWRMDTLRVAANGTELPATEPPTTEPRTSDLPASELRTRYWAERGAVSLSAASIQKLRRMLIYEEQRDPES